MFEPKWISFYFFVIVVVVQVGLAVCEKFFLSNKRVLSFYGLSEADAVGSKVFLTISSYHHLCMAIIMIVGLRYVLKLQPFIAGPITSLATFMILISGFVYLLISKKMWKIALLQIVPNLLGLFFLMFHILPAIRASMGN